MTKFLIALVLTVCLVGQPPVWAGSIDNEWELRQNFSDLGEQTVHVCHDAVRVDCHSHGFSILCKAPDWRVYCYRASERKVWVSNLSDFHGLLLLNPFSASVYRPGEVTHGESIDYAGLKSVVLRPPHAQYWIGYATDKITDNPKVGEFLNRYYYLQNSNMVPLYKKILVAERKRTYDKRWLTGDATADLRSQARVLLATTSAKKVAFRSSDFEVPQKYAQVHNANEILVSSADKLKIDDMVDSLGFTTDFDSHAKEKH